MTPTTLPLAAMVVMMWLIWSESIRPRKPSKLMYTIRMLMFATVVVVMNYNMFMYPSVQTPASRTLVVIASIVGVVGIGYFVRRLRGR